MIDLDFKVEEFESLRVYVKVYSAVYLLSDLKKERVEYGTTTKMSILESVSEFDDLKQIASKKKGFSSLGISLIVEKSKINIVASQKFFFILFKVNSIWSKRKN